MHLPAVDGNEIRRTAEVQRESGLARREVHLPSPWINAEGKGKTEGASNKAIRYGKNTASGSVSGTASITGASHPGHEIEKTLKKDPRWGPHKQQVFQEDLGIMACVLLSRQSFADSTESGPHHNNAV